MTRGSDLNRNSGTIDLEDRDLTSFLQSNRRDGFRLSVVCARWALSRDRSSRSRNNDRKTTGTLRIGKFPGMFLRWTVYPSGIPVVLLPLFQNREGRCLLRVYLTQMKLRQKPSLGCFCEPGSDRP